MTSDTSPAGPPPPGPPAAGPAGHDPQARFEIQPGADGEPATVRAAGDIDLINVAQFQAALEQAAAASGAVIADLTAVTYCDSATIRALFIAARRGRLTIRVSMAGAITDTLLKVSGLDKIAAVVTLDSGPFNDHE